MRERKLNKRFDDVRKQGREAKEQRTTKEEEQAEEAQVRDANAKGVMRDRKDEEAFIARVRGLSLL